MRPYWQQAVSSLRNTSGDPVRDGTKKTLSIEPDFQEHVPDTGLGRRAQDNSFFSEFIGPCLIKVTGLLPSSAILFLSLSMYIARTIMEMIRTVASVKRREVKIISIWPSIAAMLLVLSLSLVPASAWKPAAEEGGVNKNSQ